MSNRGMAEPSESLLNLVAGMYAEAEGFDDEDDWSNGELVAQFIPKSGVEAFAPPVNVQVGTRVLTPPRMTPVNPGIGGLAVLAIFIPFIRRVDDWIAETGVEKETKLILQKLGRAYNRPGIGVIDGAETEPQPDPSPKEMRLPTKKKKKREHKEQRLRIYGYSRRLSGSNTIRPGNQPS